MKKGKTPEGGESIARQTEDDVEGHRALKPAVAGGQSIAKLTEDDVEGHRALKPAVAGGQSIAKLTEDDVEGHRLVVPSVAGGESIAKLTEDDVEGHNIGYGSPLLARDVFRARERELQREVSRNALIREAKQVNKRKR